MNRIEYQLYLLTRVEAHLVAQGAKALALRGDREQCVYRTTNHKSCAIGCLITDEYYHADLEGLTAADFRVGAALVRSGIYISLAGTDFLRALQQLHDSNTVERWPDSIALLRKRITKGNYE